MPPEKPLPEAVVNKNFAMDIVDNLQPLVHSSLQTRPEALTVDSEVEFTPENFAAVKTATIRSKFETLADSYSVSFWFKNETPISKRPITAYLWAGQ